MRLTNDEAVALAHDFAFKKGYKLNGLRSARYCSGVEKAEFFSRLTGNGNHNFTDKWYVTFETVREKKEHLIDKKEVVTSSFPDNSVTVIVDDSSGSMDILVKL